MHELAEFCLAESSVLAEWEGHTGRRLIRAEMRPPSPLTGSSLGPLLGGAAALLGLHCASEGLKHIFKVSCAALRPALSLPSPFFQEYTLPFIPYSFYLYILESFS